MRVIYKLAAPPLLAAALLVSCGGAESTVELPGSAPDITGSSEYAEASNSLLIEPDVGETYEVLLTDDSVLVGSEDGGECSALDDAIPLNGQEIAVWHTGNIEDSEPASVEALVVASLDCLPGSSS